eukprot:snap_masked-scaffold_75-processed-gene-0.42-mRNA-1 protein AED:1.00 eAED:1.00 QI:0/0/0/0/1/1/3/0/68
MNKILFIDEFREHFSVLEIIASKALFLSLNIDFACLFFIVRSLVCGCKLWSVIVYSSLLPRFLLFSTF